jgi:prephenate dehydrogenase
MKTVAIVGVGLIGGSFGLALRKAGFTGELLGVSSGPALEAGLQSGAISSRATLEDAAGTADLIYLSQPVDRILQTLETLGPLTRPECLVTDAGSTKVAIVQKASEYLPPGVFLGGHPIAGKEQRGVQAADPDLFRNRVYVLTPIDPQTQLSGEFRHWLSRIGSNVIQMSPSEHDATVAFTSHLPQLISTALAVTLAKRNQASLAEVFGSGLLDMTRLALSPPDLWLSILATNQAGIMAATGAFLDSFTELRESILTGDPAHLFEAAAQFAGKLRNPASTKQGDGFANSL